MADSIEGRNAKGAVSLQCAICLDQLSVPKALPCLHTFCLTCLNRHITITFKAKGNKLVCPECRRKCLPPDPKKPMTEWAAQFPTNFHLQNLIEASEPNIPSSGSKMHERREDKCSQRLKEARAIVDNRLLHLGTEQQKVSALRSHVTDMWNHSKTCLHDIFDDLLSAVKEREEQLMQRLDEDYVENTQHLFVIEDQISTSMKQLRHCSDDITKMMTEKVESVPVGLARLEQRLSQTCQDTAGDASLQEHARSTLILHSDDVAKVLNDISELGTFRTEPRGSSWKEERSVFVAPPPGNVPIHRMSQNSIQPRAKGLKKQTLSYSAPSGSRQDKRLLTAETKPEYVTCHNLTSEKDQKEPFVTGVCCMKDLLLLTDVNNRSVKGLYLPSRQHGALRTDDFSLRADPLCISSWGSGRAVVGSERCMFVLGVQGRKLTLQSVVNTTKCYYGIVVLEDGQRVAACSDQPPGVDVLDLITGRITHTVSRHQVTGSLLFTSPFYLTSLPGGRLLVSDKDSSHPLTCVTTEGDVMYRYARAADGCGEGDNLALTWPLGVSRCWDDGVLVVDAAQHAVYQVSSDGRVVGAVLKDTAHLRSPSALSFCDDSGHLYVVGNKGQMLLVYQLI